MVKIRIKPALEISANVKVDIKEYIVSLLDNFGVKSVVDTGDEITAQCPFHFPKKNHKTFGVSTVEKYNKRLGVNGYWYNCFSCGESGSIIKLISYLTNKSYEKAYRLFCRNVTQAGISIEGLQKEYEAHKNMVDKFDKLSEIELPSTIENNEYLIKYFEKRKRRAHDVLMIEYIVNKYKIKYCAEGRYAGRMIIPIFDLDGRIVEFDDRAVFETKQKSLHRSGTEIGRTILGLYQALDKKICIVVEGAFSMFQVECVLRKNKIRDIGVVSIMGMVMTDERVELLTSIFDVVVLLLDCEDKPIMKSIEMKKVLEQEVKVINLTPKYTRDKDPGDLAEYEILELVDMIRNESNKKSTVEIWDEQFNSN